jgi:hypothetical protein
VWQEQTQSSTIDISKLYDSFKSLRKQYKSKGLDGDSMQNTIKLIGNAGYGKLLQYKEVYDPTLVSNSILSGGTISSQTHNILSKSSIYSSIWGNAITGIVRSILAITSWKNRAYMAVTDSIVCDAGAFISSMEIVTPYKKLNALLHSFSWECDFENVHFVIYKERDYFSFKIKDPAKETEIIDKFVKNTIEQQDIDNLIIKKAAKRGFKSVYENKHEKNIDFVKKSINRFAGEPIFFEEKRLVKVKEFLSKAKILNSVEYKQKLIGAHNIRFQCNTIIELNHRIHKRFEVGTHNF